MATVALIIHEMRDDAERYAHDLAVWLHDRGHHLVVVPSNLDELHLESALEVEAREPEKLAHEAALVVSLGGDGSMLRAVALATPHGVPVLGVNFGQLGYLTEVEPSAMIEAVEATLAGRATIEERMRVEVGVIRGSGRNAGTLVTVGDALNEALIERDESGRTVRLGLTIDDEFFISYSADGIIVASPTGSTAYSMSARGPIVAPGHQALIVTPVSPHQLFDRSLVLNPESTAEIEVLPSRHASLSLDGRTVAHLAPGDRIVCRRSPGPARIVTCRDHGFLTVLKTKFGLADR